jgi:3-methyladenine DNA glycosylase AlkD
MTYLQPLIESFRSSENEKKARQMHAYMKNLFPFLGLDAKTRTTLQNHFFKEYGYPEQQKLYEVIFELWDLPEREFQSCAINILQKFQNKLEKTDIKQIEQLILKKSWWDTVDGLAVWICGAYFKQYPKQIIEYTGRWVKSDNFWLQRTALLFQLKYKQDTNKELLAGYILELKEGKEFFVRKAIGWALREYSKTNPNWVRTFLQQHTLSPLSYREAKKYV